MVLITKNYRSDTAPCACACACAYAGKSISAHILEPSKLSDLVLTQLLMLHLARFACVLGSARLKACACAEAHTRLDCLCRLERNGCESLV